MTQYRRTVNKKLVYALIKYRGMTLESLGQMLEPPMTKAGVNLILNPDKPENKANHRLEEIAGIFHIPSEILFPYVEVE